MKATIHYCTWIIENQTANTATEEVELPSQKKQLEFLQKIVGGLIAVVYCEKTKRDLVVNDEGILLNMPKNEWAKSKGYDLYGTVVEIHGKLR